MGGAMFGTDARSGSGSPLCLQVQMEEPWLVQGTVDIDLNVTQVRI